MSDKSNLQLLLETRFQQLAQDQEKSNEVPPELRKEVFRTLDVIDIVEEVGDLFTSKVGEVAAESIDLIDNPDKEEPPADEVSPIDPSEL